MRGAIAIRIRTCRGGPSAPSADAPPGFRPSIRPSSLAPIPARHPNLKNSNREALRRVRADDSARRNDDVINVTHTKQTTRPHSNREGEALFLNRVRAVNCLLDCHGIDSARRYIARAVNRLCDCGAIASARPSIAQRAKTNLPKPGIHKTPPSSITEFNKRFRKRAQKTPSLRVSVRKKSAERFQ